MNFLLVSSGAVFPLVVFVLACCFDSSFLPSTELETTNFCGFSNRVKLSDVHSLTLYDGLMTSSRRSHSIPQLRCVGGTAGCKGFVPKVVECVNRGTDAYHVRQWQCKAEFPPNGGYRFARVEMVCEGFDRPDDQYILKGSCGLEYLLNKKEEWTLFHSNAIVLASVLCLCLFFLHKILLSDPESRLVYRQDSSGFGRVYVVRPVPIPSAAILSPPPYTLSHDPPPYSPPDNHLDALVSASTEQPMDLSTASSSPSEPPPPYTPLADSQALVDGGCHESKTIFHELGSPPPVAPPRLKRRQVKGVDPKHSQLEA